MSSEHQPLWRVDDCEGRVEFDCTEWPTVQLSFRTDEDAPEHVINLTVEQATDLSRALNRAAGLAILNGADDSTAIVEAFGHIAESIVDGERIASGGDAKWLRPLAAMLAARIPFVSGSVESGLSVDVTSSEFLDCCRSVWIGADMHRGFGRYLNLRWDVGRREWVEAGSGFAFVGADSQVAFMLETAMAENDGIRFDPMEGEEDTIQLFRLLLETAKSADIPVSWGT